jgi:hypothetical protein
MKNLLILLLLVSFSVKADEYLIKEMETLRDSLDIEDPARVELTLRLADLYFDVSIREGKETNIAKLQERRMRALDLYRHPLNGTNGIPKAKGQLRQKIEFQMARLLTRLDEKKTAEKHYLNVYNAKNVSEKLKEQSALALAEWYEEDAQYKKANNFYQESLKLCKGIPTCNYVHYRRAWLLYKDTKLDEAIAELEQSLWDINGNIRENALQDYLMFLSNRMSDGFDEFKKIKALSQKLKRPKLTRDLTEAFYIAGNRRAGSNLLDIENKSNPNMYYEIRLLEEFYGFRNWEKVEEYLAKLETRKTKELPKKEEDAKETKKIIRRLLVQLDAEAQVVTDLNPYLLRSIDIYLSLYPNDDLRKKMQQGWLKAQSDEVKKIARLEKWIAEDIAYNVDAKEIRKLRQTRLALAQKNKLDDIVIHEGFEIAKILGESVEAREFTYVAAQTMYKKKEYTKALPFFSQLVDWNIAQKKSDKWGLLSQNLILDIHNHNKDYPAIMVQADKWLAVNEFNNKKLAKENETMKTVRTQARFQDAFSLGENTKALDEFMYFCNAGIYADKACLNAKVLAVKLKDQAKLVTLLEKANDEKALLVEYELMGEFGKAAKLQEKLELKNKSDIPIYLKTALLYELDFDFKNRNRILSKLVSKIRKDKKIDAQYEALVFRTLDEADLINVNALSIPWSTSRKISLAHRLEVEKPSKTTKKIIMAQKTSVGPAWSKHVLSKLQREFVKVGKIGFYGRSSKWKFKKRTRAMDKFAKLAKGYLEGADSEARIYILQMLKSTYQTLAIELYSTPLPEGLDAETIQQVMTQLQDMAAPFEKVAADYERLQADELKTIVENKEQIVANLESGSTDFASFVELEKTQHHRVASVDFEKAKTLQEKLKASPESLDVLKGLEEHFKEQKSERLAAYFTGRINNLNTSSVQEEVKRN